MVSPQIVIALQFLSITYAAKLPCRNDEGKTYHHGEEVIESVKLWCKVKKCRNGEWVAGYKGCISEGSCYTEGAKWTYKCNKMKCTKVEKGNVKMYATEVVQFACFDDGECKKENSKWKKGCNTYRCTVMKEDATTFIPTVVPIKQGCSWNTTGSRRCFELDETVTKNCQTYRCQVPSDRNENKVAKLVLKNRGCYGLNDRKACIIEGVSEKHKCSTYKCTYNGKVMEMELEKYGCEDAKGGCIYDDSPQNNDDKNPCYQQACTKQGWVTVSRACSYEDQCIFENSTAYDNLNCLALKCKSRIKKNGKKQDVHMGMEVFRRDCKDDTGKCFKIGDEGFQAVVHGNSYSSCRCEKREPLGYAIACG